MIDRRTVERLLEVMGEDCSDNTVREAINSFPAVVESKRDYIYLSAALDNPSWMLQANADPRREIDVRMTYEDLMEIYRRM